MAWSLVGTVANVADTGTANGPTQAVADPTSLGAVAGDLLVMVADYRGTSVTLTVSEAGGQTWTTHDQVTRANNTQRIFTAIFDGTWDAAPSATVTSGALLMIVQLAVFRGNDQSAPVAAAVVHTSAGTPGSPFDCTSTGITTVNVDDLVFAAWSSEDNNTWALQTAGFANIGGAQIRNSTTFSSSLGYKVFAAAGATGNITNRQATLGGDPYVISVIAFKLAAAGGTPVVRGLLL